MILLDAPMPPAATAIAQWSQQTLADLRQLRDAHPWSHQPAAPAGHEGPAVVRALGNHAGHHGDILRRACASPGIVVLHDLSIHDLVRGTLAPADFREAVNGVHGWWGLRLLDDPAVEAARKSALLPLTAYALTQASGVVVHSRQAEAVVRGLGLPVAFLPMARATRTPGTHPQRHDGRLRLAVFGHIGPNRGLDAILDAMASHPRRDRISLDVYGQVLDAAHVASAVRRHGLGGQVRLHGPVGDAQLDAGIANSDLVLNLRTPTMGEASWSQLQAWDHGVPTVVVDDGWYGELPDGVAVRLAPQGLRDGLSSTFTQYLEDPGPFHRVGAQGRRHLEQSHAPRAYAAGLVRFVDRCANEADAWARRRAALRHPRLDHQGRAPMPVARHRPPRVDVVAFADSPKGIGEAARRMVDALSRGGCEVRARQPGEPRWDEADAEVLCVNPPETETPRGARLRPCVAAWWWELPDLPRQWVPALSQVDAVWAGSPMVADAFVRAGARSVSLVPPAARPVARQPTAAPTFVTFADHQSVVARKNPRAAIQAFCQAFPTPGTARLVVKTLHGSLHPARHALLVGAARHRPDIQVLDGAMPQDEVDKLLGQADCVVSLHRAEGHGLVLADALASGIPVLATDGGGSRWFTGPESAFLVPAGMTAIPEGCDPYPPGASWLEPDLDAAAAAFRAATDPALRLAKGQAGREAMAPFSAEATARRAGAELNRLLDAPWHPGAPLQTTQGASRADLWARRVGRRLERWPAAWRAARRVYTFISTRRHGRPVAPWSARLPLVRSLLSLQAQVEQVRAAHQATMERLDAVERSGNERADRQEATARGLAEAAADAADRMASAQGHLAKIAQDLRSTQQAIHAVAAQEDAARGQLGADVRALARRLEEVTASLDQLHADLAGPGTAPFEPGWSFESRAPAPLLFEERFRGPPAWVRGRLAKYGPDLASPMADLGCGRGEMLDVARSLGVAAIGVEWSQPAAEGAAARGHDVVHAEAIEWLGRQPDASLACLTGIQFVEHLDHAQIASLLREARRVLQPDGVLILETVNPRSVQGFHSFWVDPTHRTPLYPDVLLTLLEQAGFRHGKVRFIDQAGAWSADGRAVEYAVFATPGPDGGP